MLVTALSAKGFRDLPDWSSPAELGRVVTITGPNPASTAVGDALELAFAVLNGVRLQRLLMRWRLVGPTEEAEITGSPLPEQATWADTQSAAAICDDEHKLQVSLTFSLDPLLAGMLRAQAPREPRLAPALALDSRVHLSVGALFASSWDAVALSIQDLRIGDESFILAGGPRPTWLVRFLQSLGERFHRVDPVVGDLGTAELAFRAMVGRDSHDAYLRWVQDTRGPWGSLRVALGPGDVPILLADGLPLRRWGPSAEAAAALSAATRLRGADVLWVESEDPRVDGATEGERSALEQVWRVCEEGDLDPAVVSPELEQSAPLRFERLGEHRS